MVRRRTKGRRNSGPGPVVVAGAVLLTLGFASLLFLPMGGGPGEGAGTEDGAEADAPARTLEREGSPALPSHIDRVRVEVLNAGGVPGMAALATEHLRTRGFDVVYYGNARAFDRDETAVLDRSGSPEAALAVARALGVASADDAPDPDLLVDVTVLLGRGWVAPDPEEVSGEDGGWWSPRRLLERMRSLDQGP